MPTTRSVIAEGTYDGWRGRHVHHSRIPVLHIGDLIHLVRTVHAGDAAPLIRHLVHDHPAGWISLPITGSDPGDCMCHHGAGHSAVTLTQDNADPHVHTSVYILYSTHLTYLAAAGDRYIHKADYPWAPEGADEFGGPARTWRVIYRHPNDDSPLLLPVIVPSDLETERVDLEDAELDAACLSSMQVQSPTITGALRRARDLITTP